MNLVFHGSKADSVQKLRILTVAALERNKQGGAAGTIICCNEALRQQGHEVDEIWSNSLPKRRLAHHNLYSLLEKSRAFAKAVDRLNQRYDAVVVNEPQGFLIPAVIKRKGQRTAVITLSQGIEKRLSPIIQRWRRALTASRFKSPRSFLSPPMTWLLNRHWDKVCQIHDGFLVVNEDDRRFLVTQQGVSRERIHLWKSGLDRDFHEKPSPVTPQRLNRIIYVGQTAFYKFPSLLIDAVSNLLRSNELTRFTWITHTENHQPLRGQFPEELRGRIEFLGWMDQDLLISQLDSHGIMLFPTIVEGFGRAALEAMSRGVCVISSRSSGMQDYINDGINGVLCEVGDTEGFISAAQAILDNFEFAKRLSENGIETSHNYTWESVAHDLAAFISQIRRAHSGI